MGTDLFLSTTAPVFKVDGTLQGDLARDLLRLEVEESTRGLKTCMAHLLGVGPSDGASSEKLLYLDGAIIDFGKSLEISIGARGNEKIVFRGAISGIGPDLEEGQPPEVVVYAEDKLMRLRMTRRSKAYERMSDGDMASAIAGEHGLTPDVDADGPTYDRVLQLNQSDLAFLRDRAARIQAELWCDGDTLGFKTRGNRSGTHVTLTMGNQLLRLSARADLAHQRTKVVVAGYDVAQRGTIEQEAGNDAVKAEVSGGKTGPEVLERAFGERASRRTRDVPIVDGDATSWAKAELLRRARSFVSVSGVTRGNPELVVGSKLTLARVGGSFDGGGYYVTRVRHTYDLHDGHRTHFEAERPTLQEGAA